MRPRILFGGRVVQWEEEERAVFDSESFEGVDESGGGGEGG